MAGTYKTPKVISVINFKGGVAKTTTTVALAETLADKGMKILIIDLDPQTNATLMLIGEKEWRRVNTAGNTLAHLFKNASFPMAGKTSIKNFVYKKASDVKTMKGQIDLINPAIK